MARVDDIVRVTVKPWVDQRGIIESINGAYNIVRLDSSRHPDDVRELYPNEFVVLCQSCEHDLHEPGKCEVLHVYARGPTDPPGNQGCLCGVNLGTLTTNSNEDTGWTGWTKLEVFTCSCIKCSNEISSKSLCECCDTAGCKEEKT